MKHIAPLVLVLGLAGCLHDDSSSSDSSAADELIGEWVSMCAPDGTGTYETEELTFESGGAFTMAVHSYVDSSCTSTPTVTSTETGTFTTGGSVNTLSGHTATEINAIIDGVTYLEIFAIIDSKLYFGDDDDVPSTRPTDLDLSYSYSKHAHTH